MFCAGDGDNTNNTTLISYDIHTITIIRADDDGDKTNNTGLIVGLAVGCTGCVLLAILIATLVMKHL